VRLPAAALTLAFATLGAPAAQATDFPVTFPLGIESEPYMAPNGFVLDAPGDTVTFGGGDFSNHPVSWTYGEFTTESGGLAPRTYTFNKPGTFPFACTLHPDMFGAVRLPGNLLPVADFTVAPATTLTGTAVTFDARGVTDPDGGAIPRYEWDLDGNGSFETAGPSAVVTTAYTAPGTFQAGLRVVDDSHETSAAASHEVVVGARPGQPAAGAGGAGGAGAGGTGGVLDKRAPTARLTATSTRTIRAVAGVAKIGLRLDEAATVSSVLRRGTSRAVLGRSVAKKLATGVGSVRVKLTQAGMRAVKRSRRTRLTLAVTTRDAAGNTRTVRRSLVLTR
jgi:plastocyanin